ncbi:MAG: NYN domain-containing protein [Planctomycetota bacterium]
MIYMSPVQPSGEDSQRSGDLRSLPPDDLIHRVEELEDQIETMRRRHQIELRRGMEAVERMQQQQGAAPPGSTPAGGAAPHAYHSTHTHQDGYDVVTHQRVAILIDVQNMYYAARNLYNSKLEFAKLLTMLSRGRLLTRAIAYIVERPGMEQEKFVEVLRRNGYEVRKKVLIERSDGSQKGDWDLGIAIDAISMADKVDAVILVTGDGDFVTLVHYLHHQGVRCEVASFPETTALELIRSCKYYHRLNEKVLLPGGQFNAMQARGDMADETQGDPHAAASVAPQPLAEKPHASAGPSTGPRPGRSPVDDMELDDDEFNL